jgi:hypothetical protein
MICPVELAHEVSALSGEVVDVPGCGMKRSTEAAWERAMKIQEDARQTPEVASQKEPNEELGRSLESSAVNLTISNKWLEDANMESRSLGAAPRAYPPPKADSRGK